MQLRRSAEGWVSARALTWELLATWPASLSDSATTRCGRTTSRRLLAWRCWRSSLSPRRGSSWASAFFPSTDISRLQSQPTSPVSG